MQVRVPVYARVSGDEHDDASIYEENDAGDDAFYGKTGIVLYSHDSDPAATFGFVGRSDRAGCSGCIRCSVCGFGAAESLERIGCCDERIWRDVDVSQRYSTPKD